MKKWFSVELTKEEAENFKKFLRGYGAQYETSECFNLIHFEVLCSLYDLKVLNAVLADL